MDKKRNEKYNQNTLLSQKINVYLQKNQINDKRLGYNYYQ